MLAIAGVAGLGACNEPMLCHTGINTPIEIEVRDAATGTPAARGAAGTIRSGTYVTELGVASQTTELVLTAPGGPGVYTVAVQKPGYRDWQRSEVRVAGDGCGQPRTVFLEANLEPAG